MFEFHNYSRFFIHIFMIRKKITFLTTCYIFILFISNPVIMAQDIAIGQWRHHLPNNTVLSLTEKPGTIYAATPYGLLEYDKEFNSIKKYDKVNGLSDFGITVIRYATNHDLLLLGYQNGNLDVFRDGAFFSISDIRQSNIIGSKRINNILFDGDRAYLSCDFGIVVLELTEFVILDTWFIGPEGSMLNVYDIAKTGNALYAATEAGLLKAELDAPNLADFQYWIPVDGLPNPLGKYTAVVLHNNVLIANQSLQDEDVMYKMTDNTWEVFSPDTYYGFQSKKTNVRSSNGSLVVSSRAGLFYFNENLNLTAEFFWYPGSRVDANDAILDTDGDMWVADNYLGITKKEKGTEGFESIIAEGPYTSGSSGLVHNGGALWVATSAIPETWSDRGVMVLKDGKWNQFNRYQFGVLNDMRDLHSVTAHIKNPNRVFASAWLGGLMEFDADEGLVAYYDETNSTLQKRAGSNDVIWIGGSTWDSKGNLWVSNSRANHFLSVKTDNEQWMSYPHGGLIGASEMGGKIIVDNSDQKWLAMPRGGGIIVFKESSVESNQVFDIRKLTTQEGNGSLPSTRTTCLAKDKDGYIWVGSDNGVVVFYSPHAALRGQAFDAQSIIVVQDGFAARLFDGETINSIFVDGSNKKWFATANSGAFLLSADGRETIMHYTLKNSPLPSNNILDISVDPQTGEVFFATDRGLVSFRGFATEGTQQHSDVFAYPNPVRPGYNGYIAIKGLVTNARVKITDIAGNLVNDGFAEGGQYVWDGNSIHGQKPGSGVYLVFSTNPDGSETMVTKILFIK
jgi:ligand-binding sensor domain-containing protein